VILSSPRPSVADPQITPSYTLLRTLPREDAVAKGQVGRTKIFDGLLDRLEHDAS